MLLGIALLALAQSPIERMDALAQKRDEAGMAALAAPELVKARAFRFLKQNSTYETGRYGWRALSLKAPGRSERYVVFSTKLTSQDYGEQVFQLDGARLTRYVSEEQSFGFSIAKHDFDIAFEVPRKRVRIKDSVEFRARAASGPLLVRMSPQYRVSAVSDSAGKRVAFAQAGGVVAIASPPPRAASFTYTLSYEGEVNLPNYAGSITDTEATLTNDYWYPMIARGPATYSARIAVPKGWTIIAQGEPGAASQTSATFRMSLPVVYFSLTAGPFKSYRQEIKGKEYRVWSQSLTTEQMRWQTELNAPVVEFYEKAFGKYPFSGWGSLVSPHYGGGALEAYSYATYGEGWLPDEDSHEPAHTWWGGIVKNSYLRSLWNESFATYSGELYSREGPVGNVAEKRLAFVIEGTPDDSYNAAPVADGGPGIGPAAASLGYGKGAQVLQMLEDEIGTGQMVASMRSWAATAPQDRISNWEDFERVVGDTTRNDLRWFFDQWLRRPGWPKIKLESATWADGQVNATFAWDGPKYQLGMDVMLEYDDGTRVFDRVRIGPTPDSDKSFAAIASPRKPVLISFDPWRKVLRNRTADETPVQLSQFVGRARYYVDPARPDWMSQWRGRPNLALTKLPEDLNGTLVIGSPETLPAMKALCAKAGFAVSGNKLTYDGATIDLRDGAALAVVELGGGRRVAIALGKTRLGPRFGRARLALTDGLGRFLRGSTEPKTSGSLTARL